MGGKGIGERSLREVTQVEQKRILLADHAADSRRQLAEILGERYRLLLAEDGARALELLREGAESVSLILLDVSLKNGEDPLLEHLRSDRRYAAIPVVALTDADRQGQQADALARGAADFVSRPYNAQVVLHRVDSVIRLQETASMIDHFRHDPLTGLYTKEFFCRRVRGVLAEHPEREYDILCCDIENFKLVNDVFGPNAGDRLLKEVADLSIRLVEGDGICGRLQGDQFACMVEHRLDYSQELFRRGANQVDILSNIKNVGLKWGVYEISDREMPVDQMCDRALLAARSIKGEYNKYFARYDGRLRDKLLREQRIAESMELALLGEQFSVYFQPKYDLREDRLAGAEALVRWCHPEWGVMSPAEFIPLFERSGFITRLDQYVWDKVCATLREWSDQGYPVLPVSVNVSRADAYQADLTSVLLKTVEKYRLPPASLHLEITERAYMENPRQMAQTVEQLRRQGFVIEMDDFGRGHSSLNMFNQMTIDALKLDMSSMGGEGERSTNQGILRFIMSLARWMGLSIIAEGVETEEQVEQLREIGCDYGQGYYFARPMTRWDFEELLKQELRGGRFHRTHDRKEDQGQTLLVVDEDPDYRRQVRESFESRYLIVEAADAAAANHCLSNREYTVAAVILSLTLPEEGGFSVLEMLRGEKAVWRIPVIATAPPDPALEELALERGADDFVCRPHTQNSLRQRLLRLMGMNTSRERERLLKDEASRDYLTGLLNRRGLQAAVKAMSEEDMPLAVYLFDLDNLKQINDTCGHGEGDRAIRAFSEVLKHHTRSTDVLARYGGDEFVAVIKRMGSWEGVLKKGEEICRAFRESDCGELPTACSAGGVLCGRGPLSMSDLIARADQALYAAKFRNKGGCCLWRPDLEGISSPEHREKVREK